jgi:16S rRNA (guanine1207-N2)-methyltransferase
MDRSHYFIEDPSLPRAPQTISYALKGQRFLFTTEAGLFSKARVDPATDILLRTLPPLSGSLLDLGCGYGCLGIVLAKLYALTLTQADVHPRAVDLARRNGRANGVAGQVLLSDGFKNIPGAFDTIVLNPPIHAGKAVTYALYEGAAAHLRGGGAFYVVTLKKHGAESTAAKLRDVFGACAVLYKKKGYFVFGCASRQPPACDDSEF